MEKQSIERSGVCRSGKVSVYEMWKRQQIHDDAGKMDRTKYLSEIFGKWRKRHLEVTMW